MRLTRTYWLVFALALAACGDDGGIPHDHDPDASIAIDAPDAAADAPSDPDGDPPPPMFALTVTVEGAGSGLVYSDPVGINCPGTCSESVAPGTIIVLTAEPVVGSAFASWSGACSGTTPTCSVTVDQAATVAAHFDIAQHTITVTKSGDGAGTVSGGGLACGPTCQVTVAHGTVLALAAAPATGSLFAGWGGACTGAGACSITVTADVEVSAAFTAANYTLVVSRVGDGNGTVTSSPAGITCGADCSEAYTNGAQVTLTAVSSADSTFAGWMGAGCTGTGTCTVTIGPVNVVTATFTLKRYALTVTPLGTGAGRVISSPAGIVCGADCTQDYAHGTVVALSAGPAVGSTFTGWSGACTGTGACSVTMTAARNVGATFTAIAPNLVFVTASEYAPSTYGGIVGADKICQTEAMAGGLVGAGAGQNLVFRAWLSSSTSNAIDRIGTTRGWVRPDGKPVLDSITDIAANKIYYPPRLNASGTAVPANADIFTNTTTSGVFAGTAPACTSVVAAGEYIGTVGAYVSGGNVSAPSAMLVAFSATSCPVQRRLLCFGMGRVARVTPTATAGRFAFTTASPFVVSGGIAAADAMCQTEATAAALPGTYKALLATPGASAISRFDTTKATWVRAVDGLPIVSSAAALATARTVILDTAPNLTADGSVRFGNSGVWTGGAHPAIAGTVATTCNNWTSTAGTATAGRAGDAQIAVWFAQGPGETCTATYRKLVCLQE